MTYFFIFVCITAVTQLCNTNDFLEVYAFTASMVILT